jgi:hypothetical protein
MGSRLRMWLRGCLGFACRRWEGRRGNGRRLLKETKINELDRRCRWRRRSLIGAIVCWKLRRRLRSEVLLNALHVWAGLDILVLLILVVGGRIRVGISVCVLRILGGWGWRGDLRLDMLAVVGLPRRDRASKCHRIGEG